MGSSASAVIGICNDQRLIIFPGFLQSVHDRFVKVVVLGSFAPEGIIIISRTVSHMIQPVALHIYDSRIFKRITSYIICNVIEALLRGGTFSDHLRIRLYDPVKYLRPFCKGCILPFRELLLYRLEDGRI